MAENFRVIGFDIERHVYGEHRYPGQLVIQDVLTLDGAQFKDAALIVASPPCQAYSYMAMPWSRAKAKAAAIRADTTGRMMADLNRLFDACFRTQREACAAAGRHIPMIVENVRGAQSWVGRARWNFGSFYLWGDVPALMPVTLGRQVMKAGVAHRGEATNFHGFKVPSFRFDGASGSFQYASVRRTTPGNGARFTSRDCAGEGIKCGGDLFNAEQPSISRTTSSKSPARKMASAMIAKIPIVLARHIAASWKPHD